MVENFPNLERKMGIQIHEAQRTPNRLNPEKTRPRCIIIKLSKRQSENFESSKGQVTCHT